MNKKKQVNIVLSPDLAIKLKMDAYKSEKTMSEIIEKALIEYHEKTMSEIIEKALIEYYEKQDNQPTF